MENKNDIIETYTVPNHSNDLSERIIMASRQRPQKTSPFNRVQTWFASAHTPALSYGFASVVVIGLIIAGLTYQQTPNISSNDSTITLADIIEEEDSLLIL